MKRNLLLIIAVFTCALSFGQGEIDAYRYSNNDLSGTARGQAMGGAFGALGGDVTGVAINPAGIGVYRSSEVLANMSLTSQLTGGSTNQGSNTTFHFDNLSYVGYYPLVKGGMLTLNFGFNYSRVKSFNQQYSASSPSMNSSLTDYMAQLTNGVNHSAWTGNTDDYYSNSSIPWLSALAWDGYLINEGSGNNNYLSLLNDGEKVSPSLHVTEKGKVEAYDFTIGSNISNVFFWGATFTITNLSYQMNSSYNEQFEQGGGFTLGNYLETSGSGYQAKVGVIVKPVDALRLGVSYHSPVWYSMTDYYQGWIDPQGILTESGAAVGSTETPNDVYTNYYLRTPGSWTFSAAAVLSTQAILSLDYETTNYSSMNLRDENKEWTDVNDLMNSDYKNASTLRAGFEYRFTPQFSGRIGYAWMQNPYRQNIQSLGEIIVPAGTVPNYTLSGDANYYTAGIGFRFTPQFYCDLALVLRTQNEDLYYFPPKISLSQPDSYDSFQGAGMNKTPMNKTLKGLVTLGYRF